MAVAAQLREQVKHRSFAPLLDLGSEFARLGVAVAVLEVGGAEVAVAGDGTGEVAIPNAGVEVRFVPEENVATSRRAGVDPLAEELACLRVVRAGCGHAPSVREHLPRLGVTQREVRERLAGKDTGETPRVEPDFEPGFVRGFGDRAHGVAVEREVRFGVAVDDVVAADVGHLAEVGTDVAEVAG